jgi:homocysteine S-methyltransferase
LLADGAMGTLLYSRGVSYDHCFDALNETDPELVRGIHADYVAAGAELIETNTFGANAHRLAEHELESRVHEVNRAGARLAREVADSAPRKVWVAGSIGPLGALLAPIGPLTPSAARAAFTEQIDALVEGGVDLLILETMRDVNEALVALEAARTVCQLPVVVQLTFGEDGLTGTGSTPEDVVRALEAAGADVIGANCSTGPAQMLDVMTRMAAVATTPLSAMPNAGLPTVVGGRYMYTSSPAYMAEVAAQMVEAGVVLVGGCCGTTPKHIAAMHQVLAGAQPPLPRLSFPVPEPLPSSDGLSWLGPTALQRALGERFVVTVEVDPPRGFNFATILPKLRALHQSGYVDAIDVADNPRAQACMSALATAALIQSELGIETVLHTGVRHRNLLAIHSDLLGAHALGIRNVFVVMGDLPAYGDYPDATVNKDITASGLMRLLAGFNLGRDLVGRPLGDRTAFHIGCAFNFGAEDLDRELAMLDRKLEAGAQFALTQPVYDPGEVERVLDRCGGRVAIPVLVGILPLWNARHAAFLHNEMPGIHIPEDILRRMSRAGTGGREEGVAIAGQTLRALDGAVQGAYFMPPFEKYELVADVMAAVRAPVMEG